MKTHNSFVEMIGDTRPIDDSQTGVYTVLPFEHDLEVSAARKEGVTGEMIVSDGFGELRALDTPPRVTSEEHLQLADALADAYTRLAGRRVTLDNGTLEEIEAFAVEQGISVAEVISLAVMRWAEKYDPDESKWEMREVPFASDSNFE